MHVKRMALAMQGLINSEYPGDFLRFIEMYTFAKLRAPGEIIDLMPKPVTVHDPWVRLKADMSQEHFSEHQIHPHFTNIQHALKLARQNLALANTPNKQIILITDGLPTAHFEEEWLFMLYPPDPRTEAATMREGQAAPGMGSRSTCSLYLVGPSPKRISNSPTDSQNRRVGESFSRLERTSIGMSFGIMCLVNVRS